MNSKAITLDNSTTTPSNTTTTTTTRTNNNYNLIDKISTNTSKESCLNSSPSLSGSVSSKEIILRDRGKKESNGEVEITRVNQTENEKNDEEDEIESGKQIKKQNTNTNSSIGLSALQFQLKPETTVTNRQITLKVVPVSINDKSPIISLSNNVVNTSNNVISSKKSLNVNNKTSITPTPTTVGIDLIDINNNSIALKSNSAKIQTQPVINSDKQQFELVTMSAQQPTQIETSATTTTVNLSESNHQSSPVYYMMQTPAELTFTGHSQLVGPKINSSKSTTSPTIMNNADYHMPLNVFSSSSSTINSTRTYTSGSAILNLPSPSSVLQPTTVTTVTLSPSPIPSSISQTTTNSSPSQIVQTKLIRDERRRANHNEVERRRRDNINKWIVELSKVIPECSNDQSKHGQSKGGILEKTVLYLCELRQTNQELAEHIRSLDRLRTENELLKQENQILKKENDYFKSMANESKMAHQTQEEVNVAVLNMASNEQRHQ